MLENLKALKEAIFAEYTQAMEVAHEEACCQIIKTFQAKYKNHKLKFHSGNGTCAWCLNGQTIDFEEYKYKDERLMKHLQPLKDFLAIIEDCPTYRFISIGKVEVE
jgi:hypothetical protein